MTGPSGTSQHPAENSNLSVVDLGRTPPSSIGAMRVDPKQRKFFAPDGRAIPVEPRVMQVFVALLDARGDVVSRDELIERCWSGRIVGENSINRILSLLRRAMEDVGDAAPEIETIPKVGYRLLITPDQIGHPLPANRVEGAGQVQGTGLAHAQLRASADKVHNSGQPGRFGLSRRAIIAGSAVAALAVIAGIAKWNFVKTPAPGRRIAVLPFANLSNDPEQDYFCDGMAEEIRIALSRIGLEVIGRTSSEAVSKLEAVDAAGKLDADHVLTGSVRRTAQMIRVNTQLIGRTDGVEKWSQVYDRPTADAILLQIDIASQVASSLRIALDDVLRSVMSQGGTKDPVAQDLVLRAQTIGQADESLAAFRQRLELVDAAIARDVGYVNAWLAKAALERAIGNIYPSNVADFKAGQDAAVRSLGKASELVPRFGPATALKASLALDRLQFRDALRLADLAMTEGPDDVRIMRRVAPIFRMLDPGEKALALAQRQVRLDPLSGAGRVELGWIHLNLGQIDEAITEAHAAVNVAPTLVSPLDVLVRAYAAQGKDDEVRELLPRYKSDYAQLIQNGILAARARRFGDMQVSLSKLWGMFGDAASYQYAQIHAQGGRIDEAFTALDKAVEIVDPGLSSLKFDIYMEPLRADTRYEVLMKRLDFP